MGLIDTDRLKEAIDILCKSEIISMPATLYFAIMQTIDLMPTVETQTVKHGQMIPFTRVEKYEAFEKTGYSFDGKCSECGSCVFNTDIFCAECGVKILEDGENK